MNNKNNNQPVQLSEPQIKELFNYTRRLNIYYKDVQHEVVDHVATGVEELMSRNNDLTLNRAIYDFAGTLPARFFIDLIEEKSKTLSRFWQIKMLKYLLSFFTIPKIMITLLFYFSFYHLSQSLSNLNFGIFCASVLFISNFYFKWNQKKYSFPKEEDFLFLKTYKNAIAVIDTIFFAIPIYAILIHYPELLESKFGTFLVSASMTSILIFNYATNVIFKKMLRNDIIEKYPFIKIQLA